MNLEIKLAIVSNEPIRLTILLSLIEITIKLFTMQKEQNISKNSWKSAYLQMKSINHNHL